jgi:hypothetical protein
MRITTAYSTRYTKLDTLWSSHVAAAARKLKPKDPKEKAQ